MRIETAKEKSISNHRKMWNWIAEETLRLRRKVEKHEYFEHFKIPEEERPKNYLYCIMRYDPKHLYEYWNKTTDYLQAADLARKIAETPKEKYTVVNRKFEFKEPPPIFVGYDTWEEACERARGYDSCSESGVRMNRNPYGLVPIHVAFLVDNCK